MSHFRAQSGSLVLNKVFFGKNIIVTLIYLLAIFIVQNLKKKSYRGSSVMLMHHFWPKMTHFPHETFFFSENLLISLVSLIHAYLPATNKSQILIY